ncbi:MAG: enoyl-ACP reductase FabI [Xenococcaceae cyanobacterium]
MLDLTGKKALVTGIANNRSIAWGIAQQLHQAGAELGVTYLPDEKGRFEKKVKELVEPLEPSIFLPLDVQDDEQINSTFSAIADKWDKLDILIHCLAFADKEDLSGEFSNTSRDGFSKALDISAYSLTNLAKMAKPLMKEGGSIVTLSYLGGVKVIPNYNVMGIAKSALEMSVRYLASELGEQNIRVNAISAGPIRTLASSAVGGILDMIHHVEKTAPLRRTVTQIEVGNTAAFLCSDLSSGITGQVIYVDAGYEIMGM